MSYRMAKSNVTSQTSSWLTYKQPLTKAMPLSSWKHFLLLASRFSGCSSYLTGQGLLHLSKLNIGLPQNSALFNYIYSLGKCFRFYSFKYHLCADDSQNCMSHRSRDFSVFFTTLSQQLDQCLAHGICWKFEWMDFINWMYLNSQRNGHQIF